MPQIDANSDVDEPIEVRDQIEGMWQVEDIVKEMYSLADKFIAYKHGLV